MRHTQLAISVFSSLVLSLAGCDDGAGDTPAGDAGGQQVDAGGHDTDAGGHDTDAGEDPLTPEVDAGTDVEPSVAWVTEVEPLEIDGDRGIDFAYQYDLVLPDGDLSYSLNLERCTQMAGDEEDCYDEPRSNLPGSGYVRWGIDPSQYAVGENRYRFHLELTRAGTLIDEDTIELVVTVTSCSECGPAGEE